jgi:hypothetical protein
MTTAAVPRPLPGIRIAAAPPPAVPTLPRMDVAVLAGFAATGPIHLPVVVEGAAHFEAVFGPDAPLAWDDARGERVHACLGPAVRAFFANGGRRCWVIRLARTAASEALRRPAASPAAAAAVAVANAFAVPGVLALPAAGARMEPALAEARCEGSWSDPLRLATALTRHALALEVAPPAASAAGRLRFSSASPVAAGDLVELGDPRDAVAYAVVDFVEATLGARGAYTADATMVAAFARLGGAPASPPAAPRSGRAHVAGFVHGAAATLDPSPGAEDGDGTVRLRFDDPVPAALEPGHWACWEDGAERVWLRMDQVAGEPVFGAAGDGEPRMAGVAAGPAWREVAAAAPAPGPARGSLLTLELRVTGGAGAARRASAGLTPRHPAAWWNQLSDADFHRPPERPDAPDASAPPAAGVEGERFPLARAAAPVPTAWIPLGATGLYGAATAPYPPRATALERDGLADFGPGLFLDPELAAAPMQGLVELADAIRFIRPRTRPLLGIHAAISLGRGGVFNEATLLAIPDAVHPGWTRRADGDVPPPAPVDPEPPPHWGTHRGPCADGSAAPREGPDFGAFLDCATRRLDAPVLRGPDGPVPPGPFRLTWTDAVPGAEYVLVEAAQADLADAREVHRGPAAEHAPRAAREGVLYYQVYARLGDERSAGSNAVVVRVRAERWVMKGPQQAGEGMERTWLAVHRAALRLAAAGGDLFVALSLPRHFRAPDAVRYARRLRAVRQPPGEADADAFGFNEARAPSHGALYFPWLSTGGGEAAPPDGAALGVLASRALRVGAWAAPANQPLQGVVALLPSVPAGDRQALQDARVNLLRADPRGFLALSADTLAHEPELRPIGVRRLMTLLRRLALRRGHDYAFEPHEPVLRRAVERGFEAVLEDLFARGAFAGATPAQAFRVVTDDTVNPPREVEAGRLVVELRVAPAVPLAFLSVRLAQRAGGMSVAEEL